MRDFRDELYLHVAAQCVKWGWAIVALTAASPAGQYASVRCSERGYWNRFVPVLDFSSARAYAKSIAQYVKKGMLVAPSELYYPVRLKPRCPNNLLSLAERGVDHIEIRCVDLNPLRIKIRCQGKEAETGEDTVAAFLEVPWGLLCRRPSKATRSSRVRLPFCGRRASQRWSAPCQ